MVEMLTMKWRVVPLTAPYVGIKTYTRGLSWFHACVIPLSPSTRRMHGWIVYRNALCFLKVKPQTFQSIQTQFEYAKSRVVCMRAVETDLLIDLSAWYSFSQRHLISWNGNAILPNLLQYVARLGWAIRSSLRMYF